MSEQPSQGNGLWKAHGEVLAPNFLGQLQPEKVLFYYDGPLTFTARDAKGQLMFVHMCGEADDRRTARYAAVHISEATLKALEDNKLPILTVLNDTALYLVDYHGGGIVQCVRTRLDMIPKDCLPKADVMLNP